MFVMILVPMFLNFLNFLLIDLGRLMVRLWGQRGEGLG